jgi:hypothetical protein
VASASPATFPWILRRTFHTAAPGCHGWADSTQQFRTEVEARAAHDARFTGREYLSELLEWVPDGKQRTGWKLVVRDRRRKVTSHKQVSHDPEATCRLPQART